MNSMLSKLTKAFLIPAFLLFVISLNAQPYVVKGTVVNETSGEALIGIVVQLEGTDYRSVTNDKGTFRISGVATAGEQTLQIMQGDIELDRQVIQVGGSRLLNLGKIAVTPSAEAVKAAEEAIPVISISNDDFDTIDEEDQEFSGLLTASRDAFTSAAGFTFGRRRFRIRGYGTEEVQYYINGMPVNELENGRMAFYNNGGLNDVTRYPDVQMGLQAMDHSFGGMGGGVSVNMRASNVRKGTRISLSETNGGYRHRIMATHSTGRLKNGWSFAFSGSRRWAEEGYVEGTFYDAWSYYASADRKFNEKHSISLTAFGAPNKRGRSTAAIQEIYDITGNNFYNPYWGYQEGKKRNSRVGTAHQPNLFFTHDWKPSTKTSLSTTVHLQLGSNASSALDWYDFDDPRPDEYNRLPGYVLANSGAEAAALVTDRLKNNPELLQVDWASFYDANRNNLQTIENVNGVAGNNVTGNRSQVIIEDRHYDTEKAGFNTNLQHTVNDRFSIQAGLNYQAYKTHAYKEVVDLLGGDFYFNIDKFSEGENVTTGSQTQFDSLGTPDLNNPNQLAKEGDIWGYNYDMNIHNAGLWLQGQYSLQNLDLFVGGNVSHTQFWRTGHYKNGRFPNNSFGDSEKQKFTNFGIKGGLTYAIDGRNYLFANASYRTRAPFARNSYMAARTRDHVIPGIKNETIYGFEGGYQLKSPLYKIRAILYYTQFQDQAWIRSFYHEDLDVVVEGIDEDKFVNYALTGINKRHMGAELAVDVQLAPGFNARAVAAIGQHLYSGRPTATIMNDDDASILADDLTVYVDNYRLPGQPQAAYNLGIAYYAKNYWSFWVDLSYFDNLYLDFNPSRRTESAISYDAQGIDKVEKDSPLWDSILDQENPDGAFMLDISVRKSFKIGSSNFLSINASVNNALNTKDFVTGGYEQLRFDFEEKDVNRFPNRYFYAYGLGYYFNVTYRF